VSRRALAERLAGGLGFCAAIVVVACNSPKAHESATQALDPQTVAQVGSERISVQTVTSIASAQGISPRAALDHAAEDALLAIRAHSQLSPDVSLAQLERIALTQPLLKQLNDAAREKSVTDDEVKAAIERRWWDLDRPEMFRTTHAVVQVLKPEQEANAKEVAEAIEQAVVGVTKADEFRKLAKAVDKRGLTVTVEDLTPVAADGRTVDPLRPPAPGSVTVPFDLAFAAAASRLTQVGQISPVVRSKFGYHVILLTQRIAAQHRTFAQLRQQLSEEIYQNRARTALNALLTPLRAAATVTISEQAAPLTGLIRVEQ